MKVGIIRYPGSNCDYDALKYFENSFFIWHKETELPEDINLKHQIKVHPELKNPIWLESL